MTIQTKCTNLHCCSICYYNQNGHRCNTTADYQNVPNNCGYFKEGENNGESKDNLYDRQSSDKGCSE